ncbi:transporter substrate-binding domain-containing protein [Bdellovibrio sp. HCB288]|uniref:transporter substrate-binding domain-containing protein n=1 Tax=Bdellovibrio sp. HCB288 TaxID=3394355 RepID=UPI0039B429FA
MKIFKEKLTRGLACAVVLLFAMPGRANKIIVVGEEFPPYKYLDNGKAVGVDIEVAQHIFRRLGVEGIYSLCPGKMLVDASGGAG